MPVPASPMAVQASPMAVETSPMAVEALPMAAKEQPKEPLGTHREYLQNIYGISREHQTNT